MPAPSIAASITAIIVNYGTPELTRAAAWSLRGHYPDLPILIVENGSPDDSRVLLETLAGEIEPCRVIALDRNRHHGPGMDVGIREAQTPWALVFDSDCILYRSGLLEEMLAKATSEKAYSAGLVLMVNRQGYAASPGETTYPYVHPQCALLRREPYFTLPPFQKDGAPCIDNAVAAAERGLMVAPFPVQDYAYHLSRGTVRTYGYRLGLAGKLKELRHRLLKLTRR